MARRKGQSLGRKDVVAAALACVEEDGPESLNVNRVAQRLGIRTPSLYNHVDGADDLRRALVLEILERASRNVVPEGSTTFSSPRDFVTALAVGLRNFALENANLYLFMMAAPVQWDADPFAPTWARAMSEMNQAMVGYGYEGLQALHAARFTHATIQGYIRLELRGSWERQGHEDESFHWLLARLLEVLDARSRSSSAA